MYAEQYMSKHPMPYQLGVDLFDSFDAFMKKISSSTDKILRLLINFVQMVTQYNFSKKQQATVTL